MEQCELLELEQHSELLGRRFQIAPVDSCCSLPASKVDLETQRTAKDSCSGYSLENIGIPEYQRKHKSLYLAL
jgi:hypothetical protein